MTSLSSDDNIRWKALTVKYDNIKNLKIEEISYLKIEEIEYCCSQFEDIADKAFLRKIYSLNCGIVNNKLFIDCLLYTKYKLYNNKLLLFKFC